jgi:hypothetical protein
MRCSKYLMVFIPMLLLLALPTAGSARIARVTSLPPGLVNSRIHWAAERAHRASRLPRTAGREAAGSASLRSAVHFVPLGARLAGNAALNGHVFNYDGSASSAAEVDWWTYDDANGWQTDWMNADSSGAYSFSGVSAAPGTGEVWAYPHDASYSLAQYNETWAAGSAHRSARRRHLVDGEHGRCVDVDQRRRGRREARQDGHPEHAHRREHHQR